MLILITGGSKNGKSHIAETILSAYSMQKFYIATMEPYCEEAQIAIARHRKIRSGKGFETIEKYTDIQEIVLPSQGAVLLECACNLCANEMFSARCRNPVDKILAGVDKVLRQSELLVIVTNQVGEDGVPYPQETMDYIKKMGLLNQKLAKKADCLIEAVYGIPVILKGEKPKCLS